MKTYWEGNYGLDLQLKYVELYNEYWLFDASGNYPYSYIRKWKVKPSKNWLRKCKSFVYSEARDHFDWQRM